MNACQRWSRDGGAPFYGELIAVARSIVGATAAEDVVQAAYIEGLADCSKGVEIRSLRGYLVSRVRSRAVDHTRNTSRRIGAERRFADEQPLVEAGPEAAMVWQERHAEAFKFLTPLERSVAALANSLGVEDTAEYLGRTPRWVRETLAVSARKMAVSNAIVEGGYVGD